MSLSFSSSATVAVDKATSDLLISPDWTMNIEICDSINSNYWQAKDVLKAVKKRLQHKNPKVQLFSLTLLETMVKNCGDNIHFHMAERNILGEMIKIVQKKADMHVRNKILVLLDSWQEAFGGPGGKHPQYYWASNELRRSGVEFPKRSLDSAPIFTPPVSNPTLRHTQAAYGMPSNSSRRLNEAMAADIESLSLSTMDSMRDVLELLSDMLQALTPKDDVAMKDDVIVDLVNRCRSNQKKLMQMLTTTSDEELLGQGLELNDSMQSLLAKYDAMISGSPLPTQVSNLSPQCSEVPSSSLKQAEMKGPGPSDSSPVLNAKPSIAVPSVKSNQIDDEEEEEDEFAQLARRHSKVPPSHSASTGNGESTSSPSTSTMTTSSMPADSTSSACNALVLADLPAPVKSTKEQDIIDLLSITLSTTATPPSTSDNLPSDQSNHQVPVSPDTRGYDQTSYSYPGNQDYNVPFNSYVVPWAQPQPQPQAQPQPFYQQQFQFQLQPPYSQYSSAQTSLPWAASSSVYFNNQNDLKAANAFSARPTTNIFTPTARSMQHNNSFSSNGINGSAIHGTSSMASGSKNPTPVTTQKPFVPSYKLFEDLNVFGNVNTQTKMGSSSTSSNLAGTSGQGMVSGGQ